LAVPTITMHTEADPLVIVQNESVLAARATANHDDQRLAQFYVAPPASTPRPVVRPTAPGTATSPTSSGSAW